MVENGWKNPLGIVISEDSSWHDLMRQQLNWRISFIHRADYQHVLVTEAQRLKVDLRLGAEVTGIDCNEASPSVRLSSGEKVYGDVVIGADGMFRDNTSPFAPFVF